MRCWAPHTTEIFNSVKWQLYALGPRWPLNTPRPKAMTSRIGPIANSARKARSWGLAFLGGFGMVLGLRLGEGIAKLRGGESLGSGSGFMLCACGIRLWEGTARLYGGESFRS